MPNRLSPSSKLRRWTAGYGRQESEGHGLLQVLADPTRATTRSGNAASVLKRAVVNKPHSADEKTKPKEGPIKTIDPESVPKMPAPLLEGFEWVTLDLMDAKEVWQSDATWQRHSWLTHRQIKEVYELLSGHYVEDDEAMFRFNYSESFLNWYGASMSRTKKLIGQGSQIPRMEKGLACGHPSDQVLEACGLHLRRANRPPRSR